MPMRKFLCLLMAMLIMFTMFGCVEPERPVLRVAMSPDFPPMEFIDPAASGQDRFVGFDVSLAKYLARDLGMDLQILPMDFEACLDAVEAGEVEMAISGFSWLPDRAERFNLSDTYHAGNNSSSQVLLAREADANRFDSPAAFEGVRVGTQNASLQNWLTNQQLPGAVIICFGDLDSGVDLLLNGSIDALAVADGNAAAILASKTGLAIADYRFEVTEELTDNLIILKKGNDDLTAQVNALLAKAEAAGYYNQWYAAALELAGTNPTHTGE